MPPFHGSFQDFLTLHSDASFTSWLTAKAEPHWTSATGHPFTRAIGDGSMPEEAYIRYLLEDYTFVTDLASTLGYLVAKAPDMPAKSRLAGFLAVLTSDENDYFLRAFQALGVDPQVYQQAAQGPVTRAFADLLLTTSGKGTYAEGLTCLLCAEWCYLTWAQREYKPPLPAAFYLSEWIELHATPGFEAFVTWIRNEIDRIGPALPLEDQDRLAKFFKKMSLLEAAFFETAWTGDASI